MSAKTPRKDQDPKPAAEPAAQEADAEPFEKSLERLETIVRHLESGERGLEESMKLFEEGARLSARLARRLDQVKARVEVLIKEGSRLRPEPLKD